MKAALAVAVVVGGLLLASDHGAILVGAILVACLLAGRRSAPAARGRYVSGHAHGERALIARHEAGHAVVTKALGGRVRSAEVGDGWGLVQAELPDDDPVKAVAFLRAGREAVGTGRGCSADDDAIRKELRRVPSRERGQVKRDGIRLARREVAKRRGEIKRYGRELDERGRL
ncbi:hypothetical protein ACU61A_15605 [Pseudonocardia sichuanensis]